MENFPNISLELDAELTFQIPSEKTVNHRSSRLKVFCEKGVPKNFTQFTGKHLCQSLAQVFSCEFCEISKNTFLTEHLCWPLLGSGKAMTETQFNLLFK